MLTFDFEPKHLKFNVVVTWEYPCGSAEPVRETRVQNVTPISWPHACAWARGLNAVIGNKNPEARFTAVNIVPAQSEEWTVERLMELRKRMAQEDKADEIALNLRNIDRTVGQVRREELGPYIEQHVGKVNELMGWGGAA